MVSTPKKPSCEEQSLTGSPATKKLRSEQSSAVTDLPIAFGPSVNVTVVTNNTTARFPEIIAGAIPNLDSSVVIIVSAASAESIEAVRGASKIPSVALIQVIRTASSGLVDDSFFIISNNGELVGTINKVPIVLVLVGAPTDSAKVGSQLSSIGALSPYLSKYYGADREEKNHEDGPTPDLTNPNLPFAVLYTHSSEGIVRVTQKIKINSAGIIHSMALYTPTHDAPHLVRQLLREIKSQGTNNSAPFLDQILRRNAGQEGSLARAAIDLLECPVELSGSSYSIVYCGASWCPPCMRIIKELPSMATGFGRSSEEAEKELGAPFASALVANPTVTAGSCEIPFAVCTDIIKADYDTSEPLLNLFGIKTIPTFLVFDNQKVLSEIRKIGVKATITSVEASEAVLKAALAAEPLQNSQRGLVGAYLQKTCTAPLCMDEDF